MNIISTSYTLKYKSLDLYVSGCSGYPKCAECYNPSSWDFDCGKPWDLHYYMEVFNKVENFDSMIDNIMIFGGEPCDQDYVELEKFLNDIKALGKTIWLFTRYSIDEVPYFVKRFCNYIKCGRYIKELSTDDNIQYGVKLSTSNQKIYKKGVDY